MLAQSCEGTGSDHEACRNGMRTVACDTGAPHPIDGEKSWAYVPMSLWSTVQQIPKGCNIANDSFKDEKFSSYWLWNLKFTALCSSSCSIHRQNIFCTFGDLTKIPILQSQLWAQNVSAFTYSFGSENRTIPVQAAGLWKLTEHCLCEESLNDAQGTG